MLYIIIENAYNITDYAQCMINFACIPITQRNEEEKNAITKHANLKYFHIQLLHSSSKGKIINKVHTKK